MWHMEVPRLGVESELQLPAYTRAMAMPDLSHVCNLHHSSWQRWILNPLREARDGTHNLMVPSRIHFHCATMRTPQYFLAMRFTCQFVQNVRNLQKNFSNLFIEGNLHVSECMHFKAVLLKGQSCFSNNELETYSKIYLLSMFTSIILNSIKLETPVKTC